jgi:hypothetical protein
VGDIAPRTLKGPIGASKRLIFPIKDAAPASFMVTKLITHGLTGSVVRTFEAALHVLHYCVMMRLEAYASLTQLLRLAQFCSDYWDELTASKSKGGSK